MEDKGGAKKVPQIGRGLLVMKALERIARQPSEVPQQEAVPTPVEREAMGVLQGATALSPASPSPSTSPSPVSHTGSSVKPKAFSRGLRLAEMIRQRASGMGSGTGSSSATDTSGDEGKSVACRSDAGAAPFLSGGRGRGELTLAQMMSAVTTSPTKLQPLKTTTSEVTSSDPSSRPTSSDEFPSATESMNRLTMSESEGEAVIKTGSEGTKISALANWIYVKREEDKSIFQYEVRFEPQVDDLRLRYHLLGTVREQLGSAKTFDGCMLWLPVRLPQEVVVYDATNPLNNEKVRLKIAFKCVMKMNECTQFYNVLFNRIMRKLKMAKIGRDYYSPGSSVLVPQHKLEIWPGYVTAVCHQEGGFMLNVEVSHRVLRTNTCHDVMVELCQHNRGNFKDVIISTLIGCIVLTRYNNRTYSIDDVFFDQNPTSTFVNHRGEEMSYVDYYRSTHGITIKDLKQPLLVHKIKRKEQKDMGKTKILCLIPELCNMTGLTDNMRNDFYVMKDIAQHTRITPNVRHASLRTFIKNVNENEEARQILADWGLTLSDTCIGLQGRIHNQEVIRFGSTEIRGSELADWGREACKEKVITPVDLKPRCWTVIFSPRDQSCARNFCNMLKMVCRSLGIQLGEPVVVQLQDDRTESYVGAIKKQYHQQLQLAVIIFPTQREDRYAAVKRLACGDLCLPTQCITSRTISQDKKLRSVTQKIALQINCKLGGELWALKIPLNGLLVCGMDVYHEKSNRSNSVVGFVASMNQTLTKWYSNVIFQHSGDEIVHKLKILLLESLRQYHKIHHALPRSIMVYRDGVSDGQLKVVEEFEIPQLGTVFRHFDSYDPKLSFIVVHKRINTRVFSSLGPRGLGNPPPGTVIDHTITRRNWYDFFLVSQQVRQGTVSPTHYVVVKDGSGLKVDNMQKLTYKLTHLYYNWPGTVRVPAPCLYAHKLAHLIGQHVKKDPSVGLCDKLYYL